MKLTLDHTQRLNLHALLGAQRADLGSIRTIWAIQDRLAADADEVEVLELKRGVGAGQERTVWNPARSVPPRDLEFTEVEVARIRAALGTWEAFSADEDRRWLDPMIHKFFGADTYRRVSLASSARGASEMWIPPGSRAERRDGGTARDISPGRECAVLRGLPTFAPSHH